MSINPYAPPDSELSSQPEESIRLRFPLWTIGPLPWMAAAILEIVSTTILNQMWYGLLTDLLVVGAMFVCIASVFACVYGLIYGFILSLICRALYVTPRPKPHFWTIQAIVLFGNLVQFSGLMTFMFATLAGALMAIFNFQEKVESKN